MPAPPVAPLPRGHERSVRQHRRCASFVRWIVVTTIPPARPQRWRCGLWYNVAVSDGQAGWIRDDLVETNPNALPVVNRYGEVLILPSVFKFLTLSPDDTAEIIAGKIWNWRVDQYNAQVPGAGVVPDLAKGEEPVTLATLLETIAASVALTILEQEYGITFALEGSDQVWRPWEILAVYEVVTQSSAQLDSLAFDMGYNIENGLAYREIFGDRVLHKGATPIMSTNGWFGLSKANGDLYIAEEAFFVMVNMQLRETHGVLQQTQI